MQTLRRKSQRIDYVIESDGPETVSYTVKFTEVRKNAGYDFEAAGNVSVTPLSYRSEMQLIRYIPEQPEKKCFPLDIGGADSISGLSRKEFRYIYGYDSGKRRTGCNIKL